MAEQKLREAFELMKQGERNQAMMIIRGVLRENRQNVDAWWLMANLLEDEDKILKSLNQILELNPQHGGARKKLASMRPDLAQNLAPSSQEVVAKKKQDEAYWDKLNNPPQTQQKRSFDSTILGLLAICLQYPIVFLVIILALGSIAGLLYSFGNFFTLSDSLGNTPQDIVEAYTIAWWLEDGDALYRLSCPELYPDVDQMVGDFWGGDYSNSKVDTSQTEFDLYYYSGDQAYITIKGLMSFIDGSETYTVNWDEDAQLNGYDFYGEHVYRTNGVWQVCISRYVPNLEEDE